MTSFPAGLSAESADVVMAVKAVTYHTILTNNGFPKSAILVSQRRPLLADVLQIEIHGFVLSQR